jgi:CRP/FNR family transcriptional regulator, cyclic AMP receptor protein
MNENRVLNIEASAHPHFLAPDRLSGDFLKSLGVQAISELFLIERRMTLPAGATLYREGDAASEAYVLLDGNVRISFDSDSGRRFISKIVNPGAVLGLTSVVTGRPHAATAQVIFPVEISSFPGQDLLAFLKRRPEALWAAMREMAFENERLYGRLRTMGLSSSVPGRLARLILEWSTLRQETPRERRLHVPMTHYEIADSICASRESVTRVMNDLQKDGVIAVRGAMLIILDLEELEMRSLK